MRPPVPFPTQMQPDNMSRQWDRATDLGIHGGTLRSLNGFGGVHPRTLELGPILVTDDFGEEGRYWSLTDEGIAVRNVLLESS